MSCHGNQFLYSYRCVAYKTFSLPSFNGLCGKLTEIALFIHLMLYWVESMTSSVLSFACFTHFSNLMQLNARRLSELIQIFINGKQGF